MVIDTSGNVGIGTGTPGNFDAESRNLVIRAGVNGSNPTVGITIAGDGDQAATGRGAIRFADGAVGNATYRGALEYNHDGDYMMFRTAAQERMRIDSSGNVGIRTGTPTSPASVAKFLEIEGSTAGIVLHDNGNDPYEIWASGGNLVFRYNNTGSENGMLLSSTGALGIGTSSPGAKLEVRHATYANTNETATFINGNQPVRVAYDTMVVAQTDVPCLSITETVGDSTQATEQKLTFAVGDNSAVIGSSSTVANGIYINTNRPTNVAGYLTGQGTNVARFLNNGYAIFPVRVGIGTTSSPSYSLDVKGPDTNDAVIARFYSNTGARGSFIIRNGSGTNPTTFIGTAGGSEQLSIGTNNTEALRIDASQKVGIGTDSPGAQLHNYSTAATNVFITGHGTAAQNDWGAQNCMFVKTDNGLLISKANAANNTNRIFNFYNDNNGYAQLYMHAGATAYVKIQANGNSYFNGGNVGIGSTNPTSISANTNSLTVGSSRNDLSGAIAYQSNGTTKAQSYWDSTGWLTYVNSGTARWYTNATLNMELNTSGTLTVKADLVAYGSPSDKRLKENIKPIESALDKVMKLEGVTFDWIQKEDQILNIKEDIGFIAQDVQKVVPDLVRENEDGMLSMRHQGIAPILLEAIKELKAEIEELKKCKCDSKR